MLAAACVCVYVRVYVRACAHMEYNLFTILHILVPSPLQLTDPGLVQMAQDTVWDTTCLQHYIHVYMHIRHRAWRERGVFKRKKEPRQGRHVYYRLLSLYKGTPEIRVFGIAVLRERGSHFWRKCSFYHTSRCLRQPWIPPSGGPKTRTKRVF